MQQHITFKDIRNSHKKCYVKNGARPTFSACTVQISSIIDGGEQTLLTNVGASKEA